MHQAVRRHMVSVWGLHVSLVSKLWIKRIWASSCCQALGIFSCSSCRGRGSCCVGRKGKGRPAFMEGEAGVVPLTLTSERHKQGPRVGRRGRQGGGRSSRGICVITACIMALCCTIFDRSPVDSLSQERWVSLVSMRVHLLRARGLADPSSWRDRRPSFVVGGRAAALNSLLRT